MDSGGDSTQHQVVLITGGATGLGFAMAQTFASRGDRVAIASRRQANIDSAVNKLNEYSIQPAMGVAMDVTDDQSVEAAVEQVVKVHGKIDVLINSAGYTERTPTLELTSTDFNRMIDTHVTGLLRCAKAVAARMKNNLDSQGNPQGGAIVNIASVASAADLIETTAYGSAKAAVMGLTRALANEWASYHIRVNAILSGFVVTDLNRDLIVKTDRGRRVIERTPMARFGKPEEIAAAATFLASPQASFITGHGLVVDGGFLACGVGHSFADWDQAS